MDVRQGLEQRQAEGRPIVVGLVGCGQMGSGLVHVMDQMTGMDVRVISDLDSARALETFVALGLSRSDIVVTDDTGIAQDALTAGKRVVTGDALLLTRVPAVEAIVEATGLAEVGATVAWNAILRGKHIIMLNVETDVTVGLLLNQLAQRAGVVYTVASGDEPGVCMGLYNFARTLGFEVVCMGKGKNNVIDLAATPSSCREEALARGMNPKMLAAFKDGSKTMVEMAAVSNATGLVPDVPGMHGARVDVPDLCRQLIPAQDGGILNQRGCVEYSTGRVAPGVFAVVTSHEPRVRVDMTFVGMGSGPYYTLYRPYHLCNIETPLSVAEAVLNQQPTIVPQALVSEVVAVAKRDLAPGDVLGEVGEADYYNRIYTFAEAQALRGLPMGLAAGARVTTPVKAGTLLTLDSVAPDTSRFVYKLRQLQDEMVYHG
ncbi:MAG: hypothetical protein GXY68_05255 [Chloroflexi bacterium]|nr:hypothetical protein [Chloroflexota bacterium]